MRRPSLALLFLPLVFSCQTEKQEGVDREIKLYMTATGSTRTGSREENIHFMAFDHDGMLCASGEGNSEDGCILSINNSHRPSVVWAVANSASDFSMVETLEQLLSMETSLENNSQGEEMTGWKDIEEGMEDEAVRIELRRIASKVSIKSIVSDFSSPALKELPFSVTGVSLQGVGSSSYYGTPDTCRQISSLSSDKTGHIDFICYPGMTARLIVEAKVGDSTFFYPVYIPEKGKNLLRGCHYQIESITIRAPGNASDQDDLEFGTLEIKQNEIPFWTDGGTIDITI